MLTHPMTVQTSQRPVPTRGALAVGAGDDPLAMMSTPMKFARNSEIYSQDEPAEFLYQLVSGAVRISKLLSDGRRQISAFHFAGDTFGLEAAESHQFSAEAIADSNLLVVKRRAAMELAERDADVSRRLWAAAVGDLGRAQSHMLLLGRKTATERVAAFLLDMAARASRAGFVELPMSRYDIADYLGLTIETVSRTLTEFDHSGAIDLQSARRLVICRPGALERLNA